MDANNRKRICFGIKSGLLQKSPSKKIVDIEDAGQSSGLAKLQTEEEETRDCAETGAGDSCRINKAKRKHDIVHNMEESDEQTVRQNSGKKAKYFDFQETENVKISTKHSEVDTEHTGFKTGLATLLTEEEKSRDFAEIGAEDSCVINEAKRKHDIVHNVEESDEQSGRQNSAKKAKYFDIEEMLDKLKISSKLHSEVSPLSLPDGAGNHGGMMVNDLEEGETRLAPPTPGEIEGEVLSNIQTTIDCCGSSIEDDGESDLSDEDNAEPNDNWIPASKDLTLRHGNKAVLALAADSAGARLASGSIDSEVQFWDFAGMDASLQSFRTMQPCDNHAIKTLQYSRMGGHVLVVSGSAQASVLDRDGFEVAQCAKGDQCITDMARTKGHVGALNGGAWNPRVKEEFITCGADSTCRVWLTDQPHCNRSIIKTHGQNGLKSIPTTCCYNRDGRAISVACLDGSIQLWDKRRTCIKPSQVVRNAHECNQDITSICFSYSGYLLGSRSMDSTLKIFDIRLFRSPMHTASDLFCRYPVTNCVFSPNDQMLVTGTSISEKGGHGKLLFFDCNSFEKVNEFNVIKSHVIRTVWHRKLKQIMIGTGNGIVKVYYDPVRSIRGAKLCAAKTKRKTKQDPAKSHIPR